MTEKQRYRIVGLSPLLMHNGRLTNPLDEHTIAVSEAVKVAKKNKTETAWREAYYREFLGGLYLDEELEPCIPGELIEATIIDGAKKDKLGKAARAGILVDGNFALEYEGPRKADQLWKHGGFSSVKAVRVGPNKVMRSRPLFQSWACEFEVLFNPSLVSKKDLNRFLSKSGAEIGIGDYRPRYGRFDVEVIS